MGVYIFSFWLWPSSSQRWPRPEHPLSIGDCIMTSSPASLSSLLLSHSVLLSLSFSLSALSSILRLFSLSLSCDYLSSSLVPFSGEFGGNEINRVFGQCIDAKFSSELLDGQKILSTVNRSNVRTHR